ncbi:MAG: alpha-glucan family phosphorylase [Acidimicrobiales bacterium]
MREHANDPARGEEQAPQGGLVGYFTMEVALSDSLPTYSGGLGVLAGDYLRSAADLALPVTAVTLVYHGGYFRQLVGTDGRQSEEPVVWNPADLLERVPEQVVVPIDGRPVTIGAWRLELTGQGGGVVPVYFLDTDLPENSPEDRTITDQLYSGDTLHRLRQEAVLGLGGAELLHELAPDSGRAPTFHMNEGHSALLVLRELDDMPLDLVRQHCAFTTHTPVVAGHDRFSADAVEQVLGARRAEQLDSLGCLVDGELNMTELGIAGSSFVNGVSLRHREVTEAMFPGVEIASVTNGIHVATWAGPPVAALFDCHLPGWRRDNALLRYASSIPLDEIAAAHHEAKSALLTEVSERAGRSLDPAALTIGLARRAAPYKQTTLVFSDPARLTSLAKAVGPLQFLCSGKAHPRDEPGKELIERLVKMSKELSGAVEVVFLEQYDLGLASLLVAGSDVWLNTPLKPNEASGTSGMKAAVNGVPSLSTLDGWWIEGCVEGVTGWAIESSGTGDDAEDLYRALEERVLPTFYKDEAPFTEMRRSAVSLNGSFFNTERMAREYARSAYQLA